MMSNMQRARSRSAQVAPEFVDLCKTLYGDLVDAEVIWQDVFKAGPDQSDVSTHAKPKASLRTQFERGSNAVGFTAGLMATGAALRDDRFSAESGAGKTAQRLHTMASKIPAPISRIKGRTGAKLAAGALGVQGLNIVGDAAIASTYSSQAKKKAKKGQLVAVDKGISTEVIGGAHKMKNGLLNIWNKPPNPANFKPLKAAKTIKPAVSSVQDSVASPAAAAKVAANNNAKATKHIAQGADMASMLGTTSGKVLTGGVAAAGAAKINSVRTKNAPMSYVPDAMAKSAPDVVWKGTFSKFDDDKQLAFGWASVVSKGGVPVIDKQGDYIAINDLEDAAYSYVIKSRVGGDNHTRNGPAAFKASDMVESMVFTDDKVAKMGLPDDFPRGWWVGFKVHDDDVWSEVRKGNRTGFSIHGKGIRSDQSVDELMGYTK